jgi:hypothetical protein
MGQATFPCPLGFELDSSQLSTVGYQPDEQLLVVCFKPKGTAQHGTVYSYRNVPASLFDGLMNAPSHGSFLSQNITKQFTSFPFTKETIGADSAFQRILDKSCYSGLSDLRKLLKTGISVSAPSGPLGLLTGFENAPWAW